MISSPVSTSGSILLHIFLLFGAPVSAWEHSHVGLGVCSQSDEVGPGGFTNAEKLLFILGVDVGGWIQSPV